MEANSPVVNICLIGPEGSGKTSILRKYIKRKTRACNTHSGSRAQVTSHTININGRDTELHLWDTPGDQNFRSTRAHLYYRMADALVFFYSIDSYRSFLQMQIWIIEAISMAKTNAVLVIIGNKSDLKQQREVDKQEAMSFAIENRALFMETSAVSGKGTEKAFRKIAENVLVKKISKNGIWNKLWIIMKSFLNDMYFFMKNRICPR